MTDAGGSPREGSTGKSVRYASARYQSYTTGENPPNVSKTSGSGGSNGKGGSSAKGAASGGDSGGRSSNGQAGTSGRHPAKEIVWRSLQKGGVLESAFTKSELAKYLARLALFIETAATEGMSGVCKGFDISDTARFPQLLRKIVRMETGPATEFLMAARHALSSGANAWAIDLQGRPNPQLFLVSDLVDRISKNAPESLVKVCHEVLHEYGARLIKQALPRKFSAIEAEVGDDFGQDLDQFVKGRMSPGVWGSRHFGKTLKEYESHLVSE